MHRVWPTGYSYLDSNHPEQPPTQLTLQQYWASMFRLPAGHRQTDIGYKQFKRLLKTFVWELRSRHIVSICLNCTTTNFLAYLLTYLLCINQSRSTQSNAKKSISSGIWQHHREKQLKRANNWTELHLLQHKKYRNAMKLSCNTCQRRRVDETPQICCKENKAYNV